MHPHKLVLPEDVVPGEVALSRLSVMILERTTKLYFTATTGVSL
jgi:hypothetical protein